jgi:hypothetical protein
MNVFEYKLVTAASMNANIISPSQQLTFMMNCAIQALWTGAPVGSLSLLISNDNITFSSYTGSTTPVDGPGNFMWNILTTPYPYIQVLYTFASGSGALNITLNGKGF